MTLSCSYLAVKAMSVRNFLPFFFIYLSGSAICFAGEGIQPERGPKEWLLELPPKMFRETKPYDVNWHPSILLTIEYPAMATQAAIRREATTKRQGLRDTSYFESFALDNPEVLDLEYYEARVSDAINKSVYYALAFYDYISKQLPSDSVTLSPAILSIDPLTDKLSLRPVNEFRLPTVLTLDLYAFRGSSDMGSKRIDVYTNTMGRYYSPVFSLTTSKFAWPHLGIIASTDGAYPAYGLYENERRTRNYATKWSMSAARDNETVARRSRDIHVSQYGGKNSFVGFPTMTLLNPSVFPMTNTPPFFKSLAILVNQSLHEVDQFLSVRDQWREYIQQFDRQLASAWPRFPLSSEDQNKIDLLKRFMVAEREFISRQNKSYVTAVLDSGHGIALQKQLLAEANVLDTIQSVRDEQKRAAFFESMNKIVETAQIYSAPQVELDTAARLAGLNAIMQQQSDDRDTLVAREETGQQAASAIYDAFRSEFRDAPGNIQSIQLEFGLDEKFVRAKSHADLRAKLKDSYIDFFGVDSKTSSMSACAFNDELLNPTGEFTTEWTGACDAGRFSGYGLYTERVSDSVYLKIDGYMQNGIPNIMTLVHAYYGNSDIEVKENLRLAESMRDSRRRPITEQRCFDVVASCGLYHGYFNWILFNESEIYYTFGSDSDSGYYIDGKQKRRLPKKLREPYNNAIERLKAVRRELIAFPE